MEIVDFHDFLDRMRNPAAADLVRSIKSFIIDLSSKPSNPENDSKSVQDFMTSMEETFKDHPLWAGATLEELESAGEGLEKYLMTKLYPRTFASLPEEAEHDQRVYEKMYLLQQFIRPEHLDIPPKFQNETSWLLAQKEIQKINSYKNPRDKLVSILNCSRVILNVSMATNENPPGADEFLPVLIYVIIKANPPQLYSNLLFIQRYRHQSRLVSEAAYFYTNLVSAESFIDNLDAASLSMDEKEFQRKMISARESFDGMTNLPHALDLVSEQIHAHSTERADAQGMLSKIGSGSAPNDNNTFSVQKLQASGSLAVLEADRAGQLAREFPFMYASVGDLRVEDVESLLSDYKELVLKYYSLHKAVEKLTVGKRANMGESKSALTTPGRVDGQEGALKAQMVSEKEASKDMTEDRVDRQKAPETDDSKESMENVSSHTQDVAGLSIDDSSLEMADKNVILVNEISNSEFSLDVFQEQTARRADNDMEEKQDHATESIHSPRNDLS